MKNKVIKSDAEWKQQLTPEQYHVLRQKGTERPFTGKYWNTHENGTYKCAACGLELFAIERAFARAGNSDQDDGFGQRGYASMGAPVRCRNSGSSARNCWPSCSMAP